MKKLLSIILSITMLLSIATVAFADAGKQVISVHNTENHGLYITIGGTLVYCEKSELPFIDENNRTQVPVRAISDAMGKKVIWYEAAKVVTITDYKNNDNEVTFAIGSLEMNKNGEKITMDTKPCIIDGHTYIPLRFLGEALDCEVEYTETDRFADIIVTRTSDFAGFNQTDSITVWGNIQDVFHEGGGLGSLMPYEGEALQLDNTNIRKYNVVFMSQEQQHKAYMEVDVYWGDTLYDKTYAESENVLYTANNSFPRFLDSLLETGGNAIYVVDNIDRMYFVKYGWNINYKIASHIENLPNFAELGEFSAKDYYYLYNNELSKDIGLDLSEYAGKDVSVEIYQLRESMPEKFHPIDNARGIVIKYENEIIGAYISAGRHQVENACSLYGKAFDEITGQNFGSYISTLLQEETELKSKTPEEIIKLYFNALNEKDEQTAGKCISKLAHFSSITANILNTELYDDTLHLPLTNKTFIEVGEKRIDNIKSISNLEIKPHTENEADEKHKAYIVTFDVEYATEGAISNGGQYWICNMVYESDNTGWKIASFGH